MLHGRLSQHPPDGAETVLVTPGHCSRAHSCIGHARNVSGGQSQAGGRIVSPGEDFRTGMPEAA